MPRRVRLAGDATRRRVESCAAPSGRSAAGVLSRGGPRMPAVRIVSTSSGNASGRIALWPTMTLFGTDVAKEQTESAETSST